MILTLALVTDFISITRVKGHNSSMMRKKTKNNIATWGSPYLVVDLSDRPQRRICPCSVISLKGMPLRLCIIRRRDLPQGYALEVFGTSFSLRYALERGAWWRVFLPMEMEPGEAVISRCRISIAYSHSSREVTSRQPQSSSFCDVYDGTFASSSKRGSLTASFLFVQSPELSDVTLYL